MNKIGLTIALLGLAGVASGALGAHALKERLALAGHTEVWNTAVFYHLLHTAVLLAWALRPPPLSSTQTGQRLAATATGAWLAGILAFSGSLYWLVLGGPRWLGPITPLGGLALMVGWVAAGLCLARRPPQA